MTCDIRDLLESADGLGNFVSRIPKTIIEITGTTYLLNYTWLLNQVI